MAARRPRRVALVTGGGGALGRAICERLARDGCALAVCDIDGAAARKVARDLGGAASAWTADVARSAQVRQLFARVAKTLGHPTILVHCAGSPGRFACIADLRDRDWRSAISVHLDGAFNCLRAAAPAMIAAGFGRIVNVVSIAGLHGTVASAGYAAAKAGVIGLTLSAAKELGPYGITVNALAPGMIATPVNSALQAKGSSFIASALEQTPTRAMSSVEDLAELVCWLTGEAARNLTGQVIAHDGGAGISMGIDEYMRGRIAPKGGKRR